MAVPTNIKTLLSGNVVEWVRIEFKETWDAEASLKTICAFANDIDNRGGGYIVIGVREQDGRPVYHLQGVSPEKIDGYLKDMLNRCKLIQSEYLTIIHPDFEKDKEFAASDGSVGNDVGNLSEIDADILNMIRSNAFLTAKELATALEVSPRTIERAIRRLKDSGFLKREGSTRGKWIILK